MLHLPLSSVDGNDASLGLSQLFLLGRQFLDMGCRHVACDVSFSWDFPNQMVPGSARGLGRWWQFLEMTGSSPPECSGGLRSKGTGAIHSCMV